MSQTNSDAPGSPDRETATTEVHSEGQDVKGHSAGQEVVDKAFSTGKETVGDAWQALKIIVDRPSTGQAEAIQLLGNQRCLKVGIVFCLFFVVALWFSLVHHPA